MNRIEPWWETLRLLIRFLVQGGPVMAPLLLGAVVMWTLIIDQSLFYRKMGPAPVMASATPQALERHLPLIGLLARCAPLMGLLGTVLGMIRTFGAMAAWGAADPRAMAAGISEALISTQAGLVVAIPGLFMHALLDGRCETLKNRFIAAGMRAARSAPEIPPPPTSLDARIHGRTP